MTDSSIKKLDSGLIVFGNRKIAYDNGTTIYIENTARRDFEAADHVAFDLLVYADAAKSKVYVPSLSSAFNWKVQYDNFMKGEFPVGVTFTQDELKVLSVLKDVEAKIKAAFELPKLPYVAVEGVDIKKMFPSATDEQIVEYTTWMSGAGSSTQAPYGIGHQGIVLRLHTTKGGVQWVYNNNSHKIGVKTFTKLFTENLKPFWSGEKTNAWGPQVSGYSTRIYANSVDIGCQRNIPRSEIERIAKQLGLI